MLKAVDQKRQQNLIPNIKSKLCKYKHSRTASKSRITPAACKRRKPNAKCVRRSSRNKQGIELAMTTCRQRTTKFTTYGTSWQRLLLHTFLRRR
eukprot:20614_4